MQQSTSLLIALLMKATTMADGRGSLKVSSMGWIYSLLLMASDAGDGACHKVQW